MNWNTIADWRRVFCFLPCLGVHGEIIWGHCEMRTLSDAHRDGYDAMRRIRTVRQYRRLDHDWPHAARRRQTRLRRPHPSKDTGGSV